MTFIVKKMDNRFRLKKAGIASYYFDLDITDSRIRLVDRLLYEAYGKGFKIYDWTMRHELRNVANWYYSFKRVKNPNARGPLDPDRLTYRYYLQREEQITYLALALANED